MEKMIFAEKDQAKKGPIVGLGLLLDSYQIPIRMKMYPSNESEKPVMMKAENM